MALWVPLHQEEDIRGVVLFPEDAEAFLQLNDAVGMERRKPPVDRPLALRRSGILAKEKKFSGLCQIITASHSVTYAILAPYEGQVFGHTESSRQHHQKTSSTSPSCLPLRAGFPEPYPLRPPRSSPLLKILTLLELRDAG